MGHARRNIQKPSLGPLPKASRHPSNIRPHVLDSLRDPLLLASCKMPVGDMEPTTSFLAETGVWLAFIGLFIVPLIAIALC